MNFAEKLSSTYLRLNGFLVLPHFTVFDGSDPDDEQQHNHLDLIGVRMANSFESVGLHGNHLLLDDQLFEALSNIRREDARATIVGVAVEVKTNEKRVFPSEDHAAYVRNFLGGVSVTRLAFHDWAGEVEATADGLAIGLNYAFCWLQRRIESMEGQRLSKEGSWNWSESFLADILALRRTCFRRRR